MNGKKYYIFLTVFCLLTLFLCSCHSTSENKKYRIIILKEKPLQSGSFYTLDEISNIRVNEDSIDYKMIVDIFSLLKSENSTLKENAKRFPWSTLCYIILANDENELIDGVQVMIGDYYFSQKRFHYNGGEYQVESTLDNISVAQDKLLAISFFNFFKKHAFDHYSLLNGFCEKLEKRTLDEKYGIISEIAQEQSGKVDE